MLAAQRAGVKSVLLPARNEKDLREVPTSTCEALKFVWMHDVDDAIRAAFASEPISRLRGEGFELA